MCPGFILESVLLITLTVTDVAVSGMLISASDFGYGRDEPISCEGLIITRPITDLVAWLQPINQIWYCDNKPCTLSSLALFCLGSPSMTQTPVDVIFPPSAPFCKRRVESLCDICKRCRYQQRLPDCHRLFLGGEVDLVGGVGASNSTGLVASAGTGRSETASTGAAGGLDVLGGSLVAGAAEGRLLSAGAGSVLGWN